MIDILDTIASIQAHGGMLLVIIYGVIELRRLRRDFNIHEHGQDGKAFVKLRRG